MRVVGIDINPSGIKVVRLDKGFRDIAIVGVAERSFVKSTGPEPGEIEKTLATLKQEGALEGDMWATSLSTDKGYLRLLEVPPADPEKTNLLVRNELDGATPEAIDENTTIASQIVYSERGKASKTIAAMVQSFEVSSLLGRFAPAAIDPQLVTLDGAALAGLAGKISPAGDIVFIDIGMQTSTLIVTQNGVPALVRTIKRGLWPMIQRASRAAELPPTEFLRRLDQITLPEPVIHEMVQPLAVEIRRSVQGLRREKVSPTLLIVSGEGSQLKSLPNELALLTGLTAAPFSLNAIKFRSQVQKRGNVIGMSPLFTNGNERFARAIALAFAAFDKSKALSLRQGSLAFRGDFSRVAGQITKIASMMVVLLGLGGIAAYAKYRVLLAEERQAVSSLSKPLKETTGKDLTELSAIDQFLTGTEKSTVKKPWPEKTGFDILLAVSQKMPKDAKIDINKITIQPKKTTLQGEIDNAGDVDLITTSLKEFKECFKEMKPGSVKQITNREGKQRHEFTLDVETTCP